MRRLLLAFLLALSTVASAAVPRLKPATTPLTPAPLAFAPLTTPPALAPGLSGAAPLVPTLAAPAPGPLAASALPLAALSAPPSEAPAMGRAAALAALREHGALAGRVAESGDAAAAEANFSRAAGFGETSARADTLGLTAPADAPRSRPVRTWLRKALKLDAPAAAAPAPAADPLYARLLERVALDDRGSPVERAALEKVVSRMLQSPTARAFAEQFIAEGLAATVRFAEVEGSKVYEFGGRRIFYAPRAFTDWQDGAITIRLNRDYLDSDPDYFSEDAPPTLAHELLGHGLWYGRMAKLGQQALFHVHENNEVNAKLVGFLASWELNRRFHDTFAWEYLADPAGYLRGMKLRQPYYSVTYTTEEMGAPIPVLQARLDAARQQRGAYEKGLANVRSWHPIIEHFVSVHGVAEARFTRLREDIAQREAAYRGELENLAAVESVITQTIEYYQGPGAAALPILAAARDVPELARLRREVDEMTAKLRRYLAEEPARPPLPLAAWPEGQIDWDELVRMHREDSARSPEHWRSR